MLTVLPPVLALSLSLFPPIPQVAAPALTALGRVTSLAVTRAVTTFYVA